MLRDMTRAVVGIVAMAAAALTSSYARADDKQQCLAASDEAQQLRDEGKYRLARDAFAACSRDVCPALVRHDCVKWLAELEQSWPSIVVSAKDDQGGDLVDVRVRIDGAALLTKLDGTPTPVDPGPHVLRFETDGAAPVERQIVVHAGEKSRLITVQLGGSAAAAPTHEAPRTAPPTEPPAAEPSSPGGGPPVAAWIFGGVALAAFGTEAYFGVSGLADRGSLEGQPCAPLGTCSQSSVDSIRTKFILADVALGVGLVSAGLAAYFFLTAHRDPTSAAPAQAQAAAAVDVGALPGGGAVNVTGRF
jgi:hypothetical protein